MIGEERQRMFNERVTVLVYGIIHLGFQLKKKKFIIQFIGHFDSIDRSYRTKINDSINKNNYEEE